MAGFLDGLPLAVIKKTTMIKLTLNIFRLSLSDNKIDSIIDLDTGQKIKKFFRPLTGNQYKIYLLSDAKTILYIGTTKSSIKNRLRYGLKANGQNGYHGYKWKNYKMVTMFVWCFEDSDKDKVENIEAELAFIVRKTSGRWPVCQNEIHFNNHFIPTGKLIAEKLHRQVKSKMKNHR